MFATNVIFWLDVSLKIHIPIYPKQPQKQSKTPKIYYIFPQCSNVPTKTQNPKSTNRKFKEQALSNSPLTRSLKNRSSEQHDEDIKYEPKTLRRGEKSARWRTICKLNPGNGIQRSWRELKPIQRARGSCFPKSRGELEITILVGRSSFAEADYHS